MGNPFSDAFFNNPKVKRQLKATVGWMVDRPLICIPIVAIVVIGYFLLIREAPTTKVNMPVTNSPGAISVGIGNLTVQRLPRAGLRQLGEPTCHDENGEKVTVYKFGAEDMGNTGPFNIVFTFSQGYETVKPYFVPRSVIDAHGGLNGQLTAQMADKLHYTIGASELGPDWLMVEFSAPSPMNATTIAITPSPSQ